MEVLYCMTKEWKLPTKSVSKQESKESAVIWETKKNFYEIFEKVLYLSFYEEARKLL
jgi:hypothetical protein